VNILAMKLSAVIDRRLRKPVFRVFI
jgi:hypothetical protein